jgi:hypothetical protein
MAVAQEDRSHPFLHPARRGEMSEIIEARNRLIETIVRTATWINPPPVAVQQSRDLLREDFAAYEKAILKAAGVAFRDGD